jgi:hypothetical protein
MERCIKPAWLIWRATVQRAIRMAGYLETHARRIYASNLGEVAAGKAILAHIRKGDLIDGFAPRDIQAWLLV